MAEITTKDQNHETPSTSVTTTNFKAVRLDGREPNETDYSYDKYQNNFSNTTQQTRGGSGLGGRWN